MRIMAALLAVLVHIGAMEGSDCNWSKPVGQTAFESMSRSAFRFSIRNKVNELCRIEFPDEHITEKADDSEGSENLHNQEPALSSKIQSICANLRKNLDNFHQSACEGNSEDFLVAHKGSFEKICSVIDENANTPEDVLNTLESVQSAMSEALDRIVAAKPQFNDGYQKWVERLEEKKRWAASGRSKKEEIRAWVGRYDKNVIPVLCHLYTQDQVRDLEHRVNDLRIFLFSSEVKPTPRSADAIPSPTQKSGEKASLCADECSGFGGVSAACRECQRRVATR